MRKTEADEHHGADWTDPAEVGLAEDRLAVADGIIQGGIDRGVYPAAAFLVGRGSKMVHHKAFGQLTEGRPALPSTIFDLASLTKPIVASALLSLVEDGKILLTDTVADWIPDAAGRPAAGLRIQELATHTSGLASWLDLSAISGSREDRLSAVLNSPLQRPTGTKYVYSDLGYILLGEVIARADGTSLDSCVQARVLDPLKMLDTGYLPDPSLRPRIAPTANDPSRPGETFRGAVHDGNANALGGVAGHAGLFGTAEDLGRLLSMLSCSGVAGGRRIFGVPTVQLIRTSQIPAHVGAHSIGWFTAPNPMLPRGDLFSDSTFGHTGFTGTMMTCDPELGIFVALLTNRVMSPLAGTEMSSIRRKVLNAVASAVID